MKALRIGLALAMWAALGWWLSGQSLSAWMAFLQGPSGAPAYVLIYALRPLAFMSAGLLSALGGSLFGPLYGFLLATAGCNLSALVAYGMGRVLGDDVVPRKRLQPYARRLHRDPFGTILLMRAVIVLPYDIVSYLAAVMRLPLLPFAAGTAIGNIPGTLMFTLAGASLPLEEVLAGRFRIDPYPLIGAAVIMLTLLFFSRRLRRKAPEE